MGSQVFLCHATADKPFVRRLGAELERFGFDVWIDERNIAVGDSLRESIEAAMDHAKFVIVVLSPTSVRRPWVRDEISAAFDIEMERGSKIILPVLLRKANLPRFLRTKKYADFRSGFARGFRELLHALENRGLSQQFSLETVDCHVTLDVRRVDGSLVAYRKRQVHRCLQAGVSTYIESLSTDGNLSAFKVSPGQLGEVSSESGVFHVTTRFPEPLRLNRSLERMFSCVFHSSFTNTEEYWEERQHYPTRRLVIQLVCRKGRPPQRWWAYEKRGPDRFDVSDAIKAGPVDGRPALTFTVVSPRLSSSYVLRWTW